MKIAIDARLWDPQNAGISRYLQNLIFHLQKIDKKNKYFVLLRQKEFNKLKFTKNFKKVPAEIPHYGIKEQTHLTRILNNLNVDFVHFPHFNTPLLYKGKFIVTIHDLTMHKSSHKGSITNPLKHTIKKTAYKEVFKNTVKKASKIITPSNFVKNDLLNNFPLKEDKLKVIYEGVASFSPHKTKQNHITSKDENYILYVGSLYPHKNIPRVIEAVKNINNNQKKTISLLISSKEDKFFHSLKKQIQLKKQQKYVKLLGFVPDSHLHSLYKNAQAFIFPSLYEGFGLPGLEAMAHKTLLLASDIPTHKEIYKDNCLYFNPFDFTSIQREIKYALSMPNNKKKQIISKAHLFVKRYSWEKMAKETLDVYKGTKLT
jgi:glycosyltransferase involved in cell wall biosynthesis